MSVPSSGPQIFRGFGRAPNRPLQSAADQAPLALQRPMRSVPSARAQLEHPIHGAPVQTARWIAPAGLQSAMAADFRLVSTPGKSGERPDLDGSARELRSDTATGGSRSLGPAPAMTKDHRDARSLLRIDHDWQLRRLPRIHRRLREALTMETAVVATAATALLIYLFFSLIRPERF